MKCTLLRHRHHPGYQFHHTLHRHPTPRRKTVVWEAHRRQLSPRQAGSRVSSWPHSRKQLPCLLAGWIQSHRPLRDPDFRLLLPLLSDLFISQSLLSFVQSILFLLLFTFFFKTISQALLCHHVYYFIQLGHRQYLILSLAAVVYIFNLVLWPSLAPVLITCSKCLTLPPLVYILTSDQQLDSGKGLGMIKTKSQDVPTLAACMTGLP